MAPGPYHFRASPKHVTQREWADDIGKSQMQVWRLRQIWSRWGDTPTCQRPTFAEAFRMAETSSDTPEEASAIKDANRAARLTRQAAPRSRAEIIREHLADPEVARQLMSNPDTARDVAAAAPGQVGRALAEHHDRVREHVERGANADLRENLQTRVEVLNVLQALGAVRVAIPRLQAIDRIQPIEMEMLVEEAQQTLASVQWLATLTPDQAELGDEVTAFLASQS